ncbi:MAG TPA: hypothetical protein VHF92_08935 [Geodermatophilus sp.]|nr:hypothetical protein [Geodermatophilus sp.]
MPPRPRLLLLALGLVLALVAGCSGNGADRRPGARLTEAEADVLADLLVRNREEGGADFVVTAPYAEGTVLTLTGEVDFAGSVGRAQAVTRYDDGRAEQVRTLFFTPEHLWFGDVPGLAETLAAAGLPGAAYVRRPAAPSEGEQYPLTDLLARLVLNLAADEPDDPGAFLGEDYSWRGQRSIDGELASVYASEAGWSVAVDASSDLLVQYVTELPGQDFDATVSLSDHGPREIAPPGDDQTVDAAEHPQAAAAVGL